MMEVKLVTYPAPPQDLCEVLRYCKCKRADSELLKLVEQTVGEAAEHLSYKVCYSSLPVQISDSTVDFGVLKVSSSDLARNLSGCRLAVVFCATVGFELDRIIMANSRISPTKALILQGYGTERVEALCDMFCESIVSDLGIKARPRYSPGYGDLSLDVQRDILSILQADKLLGVSLNASMLASPSKTVTAFLGLIDDYKG